MRFAVLIAVGLLGSGCASRQSAPPEHAARLVELQAQLAKNAHADSVRYGTLLQAVARLDSLVADAQSNPRRHVSLRVF